MHLLGDFLRKKGLAWAIGLKSLCLSYNSISILVTRLSKINLSSSVERLPSDWSSRKKNSSELFLELDRQNDFAWDLAGDFSNSGRKIFFDCVGVENFWEKHSSEHKLVFSALLELTIGNSCSIDRNGPHIVDNLEFFKQGFIKRKFQGGDFGGVK
jgi:hypothetical protein